MRQLVIYFVSRLLSQLVAYCGIHKANHRNLDLRPSFIRYPFSFDFAPRPYVILICWSFFIAKRGIFANQHATFATSKRPAARPPRR